MSPDDRRRAIVDVVVPLLLQHGDGVTTRQIAEAAGIAEGTIFRVFPDKAALLLATAEETMNPSSGREELADALRGLTDLRKRVLVTAEVLSARSEKVMAVMMALRGTVLAGGAKPAGRQHGHRHEHRPAGPPPFMAEAQRALLDRLTDVFEPHRSELGVEPRTAALLLRTLVLGSRHPGVGPDRVLTPVQITDALVDGIRSRDEDEEG
jgi:AcrR family transcriptional regulator